MRVCEVTPYSLAQLSGVSTVVADLARELVKRGNSAAVVAPGPQVSGASATFEQWPINLHHSLRTLEFSLAVARLLIGRRRRWDMLHVHQAHLANLGAVVVSRVLGKPAVATFHSVALGTTSFGGMLERTSQSIIPRLCAGVAFVSEQTQREFGIGGQVIHNGVDPDRFPRTTNSRDRLRQSLGLNGFVVAFSGRRTRSKGYFDLLR